MSTRNFSDAELTCHCGCGLLPPQEFQDRLQELREEFDTPMVITSGARCPEHNARVSKTGRTGPHTRGAVDVLLSGPAVYDLVRVAQRRGWSGIGLRQSGPHAQRIVHLDRLENGPGCPRPRIWTY